jgi:hypothetical protein
MRSIFITIAAALAIAAVPSSVQAAPCKDAKGKFVKCTKPASAAPKKGPCRDAKGKFIKCK